MVCFTGANFHRAMLQMVAYLLFVSLVLVMDLDIGLPDSL